VLGSLADCESAARSVCDRIGAGSTVAESVIMVKNSSRECFRISARLCITLRERDIIKLVLDEWLMSIFIPR